MRGHPQPDIMWGSCLLGMLPVLCAFLPVLIPGLLSDVLGTILLSSTACGRVLTKQLRSQPVTNRMGDCQWHCCQEVVMLMWTPERAVLSSDPSAHCMHVVAWLFATAAART